MDQENLSAHILVVDDEESIRLTFNRFLTDAGYRVTLAESLADGLRALAAERADFVISDILLGDGSGMDIVRTVKEICPNCPVALITGNPNVDSAAEAVRLGAFDYIPKPIRQDMLLRLTRLAVEQKRLVEERGRYRMHLEAIFRSVREGIITVDQEMKIVSINRAAESLCGISQADRVAMDFAEFTSGCEGRCREALLQALKDNKICEAERFECRKSDRGSRVISLTTSPLLSESGDRAGAVLVLYDETRLVQMERDLGSWKQFHKIIGRSEKMREVYSMIQDLADISTTVLITGESGTGKELVADAIHFGGGRKNRPFVKVDCMSLPEELLESELFGHEKGAFTGAVREREGRFERANGGTIFLDEIGDITPRLQLRLLRVLQEREFERVGGSKPIKVDVRVITATNQNLSERVREGRFREDLFYRLNVMEISLPPLRDRKEDISLLVPVFLEKFNGKLGKDIGGITSDVETVFTDHDWPGNVRELENVIEHACVRCRGRVITIDCLPQYLCNKPGAAETSGQRIDRESLLAALGRAGNNKARAARALGISRQTIYRKIKELGIDSE